MTHVHDGVSGTQQSPMRRGLFITFDGPDGSGKTTQISLLAEWLRSVGHDPVLLRQPGGTPLGERIRGILLDSRSTDTLGEIDPLAELALMFGDRAQSIAQIIQPALQAGRIVLCDRYTDSSEAYQGGGRGLGTDRVLALHQVLCHGLEPDLTILLLPDLEAALERARSRNEQYRRMHGGVDENRFEAEGEAFYRRVHEAYETIAQRDTHRVAVIGGNDDINAVAQSVRRVVSERVESWLARV